MMTDLPRILIADPIASCGITLLQACQDIAVTVRSKMPPDILLEDIARYEGLIVRSTTQVTASLLDAALSLKIIGRAGVGVDNIDVEAATQRGIVVMNTPVGNANAAAEHTIAMILALSLCIPQASTSTKAGHWDRHRFLGVEVRGKVLGIVGLGRIGRLVAQKAQGLGMVMIACDPFVTPETAQLLGVDLLSLPEVLQRADYLTLHTPKTPATRHLIDREVLTHVKPGVRIVNCARGGLIDEGALYEALCNGTVASAALDVFTQEPPPAGHALLQLPNVICTPHLGAQTEEAQERVALAVAQQMLDFFVHGRITHAVNEPPTVWGPQTRPAA